MKALIKRSCKEEEIQLFEVEKMTTQNKILNKLVNKEAVLVEEEGMMFV
jgi:hypothetical protein